jgi:hypothetical protein
MTTLQERIAELMQVMSWTHTDLVRISGQSSSLVSQWRGQAARPVRRIAKIEAAEALEAASGFSALWIATGRGPKFAARSAGSASVARSDVGTYTVFPPSEDAARLVERLARMLEALPQQKLHEAQLALQTLAAAPDSQRARDALARALAPNTTSA